VPCNPLFASACTDVVRAFIAADAGHLPRVEPGLGSRRHKQIGPSWRFGRTLETG
jgi:hypothetical protein